MMGKGHLFQAFKLLGLSCLCHQTWVDPNNMLCFAPQG